MYWESGYPLSQYILRRSRPCFGHPGGWPQNPSRARIFGSAVDPGSSARL